MYTCKDCCMYENCSLFDLDEEPCIGFADSKGRTPRYYRLSQSIDALIEAMIYEIVEDGVVVYMTPSGVRKTKEQATKATKEWLMELEDPK